MIAKTSNGSKLFSSEYVYTYSEYSFGYNFSKCNGIKEALDMLGTKTVEGLYSLEAINKMLKEKNIEIASINYIYEILYNNLSIESALINLNKGSN